MFKLLYPLSEAIQPYLVPICFCLAWGLIAFLFLSIWSSIRASLAVAKRMHQIPCTNCCFFTDDHRLKCTVQPSIANTEAAIRCSDFCPKKPQITVI